MSGAAGAGASTGIGALGLDPGQPGQAREASRSCDRHDERKRQNFGEGLNELDRVAELVRCESPDVVLQLW